MQSHFYWNLLLTIYQNIQIFSRHYDPNSKTKSNDENLFMISYMKLIQLGSSNTSTNVFDSPTLYFSLKSLVFSQWKTTCSSSWIPTTSWVHSGRKPCKRCYNINSCVLVYLAAGSFSLIIAGLQTLKYFFDPCRCMWSCVVHLLSSHSSPSTYSSTTRTDLISSGLRTVLGSHFPRLDVFSVSPSLVRCFLGR